MAWIWEHKKWPNFTYEESNFLETETEFYKNAGIITGLMSHLNVSVFENLKADILTQEAISTSNIEGEILQRASVQSSIRNHLGLKTDDIKIPINSAAIANMMSDVYLNFDKHITHQTFFTWHTMLMNGRRDLEKIGDYRFHTEPMQIISGNLATPKLFYKAPPSYKVYNEMSQLINWCNKYEQQKKGISIIAMAGIAHLHFEIIHPFEDGNGRIGRALIEKIVSQKLKTPSFNSFAKIIELHKKEYYTALQNCNHTLDINKWLIFFSKMLIESQQYTIKMIRFILAKNKFFEQFGTQLNDRQQKVILRIFEEGIEGFKGGLSASNYKAIAATSTATSTRDLHELVSINAMVKKGELRYTRYYLDI